MFYFTCCAAPAASPSRQFVILPQALETNADGKTVFRTIIVNWRLNAAGSPHVEEVRVSDAGIFSGKECSLTITGDLFSGTVRLLRTGGWDAAVCRFSGPLLPTTDQGTFEIDQAGKSRTGIAHVMSVYETGQESGRALRAWIPAGRTIRGIFLWGNGGINDDRHEVFREHWRAFCRLHSMALIAMAGFDSDMNGASGKAFRAQLAEISQRSGHSELEHLPILFTGHSNGGMKAWDFNALFPGRVIAFTVSKAANSTMRPASIAAQRTPAIFVVGQNDAEASNSDCYNLFLQGRPKGAPWAFVVESGAGHKLGRLPHFWLPFFDWAVSSRCVNRIDGSLDSELAQVDPMHGWIVLTGPRKKGEPMFGPASKIGAGSEGSHWVPSETVALALLGVTSPMEPLRLSVDGARESFFTGQTVKLNVVRNTLDQDFEAELYINARRFAPISSTSPALEVYCKDPGVYVATAVSKFAGKTYVSYPVTWVVQSQ